VTHAPLPQPHSPAHPPPALLILASSSPYRRELLQRLGIPFETVVPGLDESPKAGESPETVARRLAHAKAAVVAGARPDAVVIGSDQTATLDGIAVIGKPGTHERALAQLRAASGRTLAFHTGVCVVVPGLPAPLVDCVTTRVTFRALTDREIERYLEQERPYDCAGAAKSEALGIALLESLDGPDPTALVGLPLIRLSAMLRQAGFRLP
jgi:septum formation protein